MRMRSDHPPGGLWHIVEIGSDADLRPRLLMIATGALPACKPSSMNASPTPAQPCNHRSALVRLVRLRHRQGASQRPTGRDANRCPVFLERRGQSGCFGRLCHLKRWPEIHPAAGPHFQFKRGGVEPECSGDRDSTGAVFATVAPTVTVDVPPTASQSVLPSYALSWLAAVSYQSCPSVGAQGRGRLRRYFVLYYRLPCAAVIDSERVISGRMPSIAKLRIGRS